MDELKKYFYQQREQLDTDVPGEVNWQHIRRELHPAAPVKSFPLFKWAAAASLVILTSTAVYFLTRDKQPVPVITASDSVHHKEQPQAIQPKAPVEKIIIPEKRQPVVARQKPVKAVKTLKQKITIKKADTPVYGFENIEASYTSMVDLQLERVRTQPIYAEDAGYFDSFKQQFARLAEDEEQVKKNVMQTGMADEYIDELINIYQEKISVLKRLRFEINKMNNRVRQTDPGVQQIQPSYINL
jgi:hypothetical protein